MLGGGNNTLCDVDKKVLDILSSQLLVNKGELIQKLGISGINTSLDKLMGMKLIDKVESLGVCYVITQYGIRALKGDE